MANFDIKDIEFLEPEGNYGPAKATVHRSGKLGFSHGAHKLIDFEANKTFKIGRKKDDNGVLFLIPVPSDEADELTFTIYKTGGYYYLKTKKLLNQLEIDYRNEQDTISFDIDEVPREGQKLYKMTRRKKKHKPTQE